MVVLSEQAKREQQFHDDWAKSIALDDLMVDESFESPTAAENQYALRELGDIRGKKVLDLGCGAGESSVYLAKKAANVYACDVSSEFLKVASRLAQKHGVDIHLQQVDSSRLPYEDNFFDYVYANGVLHHVDLEATCKELARVLKPGGKGVFIEPLPYNPAINLYRWMARAVRTADEKPLTYGQIFGMKRHFKHLHHKQFWLFTLTLFLHFYFVMRWSPSKVRYWKKIIEEGYRYKKSYLLLRKLDDAILRLFPFMGRFCWNTVITASK